MENQKVLLDIGYARVFSRTEDEGVFSDGPPIFLEETRTKAIYGPFLSISEAMSHYRSIVKAPVQALPFIVPDTIANVIHIDFKMKKRLA